MTVGSATTAARPAATTLPVYRVARTADGASLLRVADDRRCHAGTLARVDRATLAAEFEADPDPDAGRSPAAGVKYALQGLYWSVRRFRP